MKQLAFLNIPLLQLWRKKITNLKPLFMAKSTYFLYIYLSVWRESWAYFIGPACIGMRPLCSLWKGLKFGNQLEPPMYGVSSLLFKWTPDASGYWCKVISKMSQSFGLDQTTNQICVQDNTWATRRLYVVKKNVVQCLWYLVSHA